MAASSHTSFRVANNQVHVHIHEKDEQLRYGLRWALPYLDLPGMPDRVHIRVEFDPPTIHLSPLGSRQAENIGKTYKPAEASGLETLKRIIERRIESELAWMRRFVPRYKQLERVPSTAPSVKSIALRALGLDALADYARFLTHYPPLRVWEIADNLRRASPRFIEPNLVDSRSGWERRLPPQGQLRRKFAEFVSKTTGDAPISLFEILGGDSISLASVMETWPERFGPRRRLLKFSEDSLNEGTWDDLLGARVNGSLSPETSDTTERLVQHLLPLLERNQLAVTYVLALMGFTLLGRPLGLTSLLDPQLGSTAIPETLEDDEVEHAYDLAAAWIEKNQ